VIAVIADDLTGAAEIGGAGLRYGLSVEVQTVFDPGCRAELLVIDSDTRSQPPHQAVEKIKTVAEQIGQMSVGWLYKKVDSVLRGPVLAELAALLDVVAQDRVLLVPANPASGRKICAGQYSVDGKGLHKTDFAADPEYPAWCADVVELLGRSKGLVTSAVRRPQRVGSHSITVGDATSVEDLLAWARKLDARTIAAGAAEFFAAILETRGFRTQEKASVVPPPAGSKELFVCTSVSAYSRQAVEEARDRGVAVCEMPLGLFKSNKSHLEPLQQWIDETVVALSRQQRVIVTIGRSVRPDPELAERLRRWAASLVQRVLDRSAVRDLYIEGGATASMVVHQLGWRRFFPCLEVAPGVVRMTVQQKPGFRLTIKPGSYPWPDNIWVRT
jgi:uncharacterized protein YgbK (DUF1537 family)